MIGNKIEKKVEILRRMERNERRKEEGGEGWIRLSKEILSGWKIGGIEGKEVINGMRRSKIGDGRNKEEGIGG